MTASRDEVNRRAAAERSLVYTAFTLLELTVGPNFEVWRGVLQSILPDCVGCSSALAPLRRSADKLVHAKKGGATERALSAFQFETRQYAARAAANSFEKWKSLR